MEQIFEWQMSLLNNPVYFGIFLVVMWCLTLVALSKITGWSRLAEKYKTRIKPESKLMYAVQAFWGSIMLAGNIYTIGTDRNGLFLGVLLPFRIGHPPLLIPWHEIRAKKVDGFIKPRVQLIFGNGISRPFEVYEKTAKKIEEGSNGKFSY